MKKSSVYSIFILSFFLFLGLGAQSQLIISNSGTNTSAIAKWDYVHITKGNVIVGDVLTEHFPVTNLGTAKLFFNYINAYHPDVQIHCTKGGIDPGQTGILTVTVPVRAKGVFDIGIKVSTNGGDTDLRITGRSVKTYTH